MGCAPQEDIGFIFGRKWIIEHSFVVWKWLKDKDMLCIYLGV